MLRFGGVGAPYAALVWGARAPWWVKFFCWLLVQRRIYTRDVPLRKNIVAADAVGCPICSETLECADHLIFSCPFAEAFSRRMGISVATMFVDGLGSLAESAGSVIQFADEFAMLCCWQLWKHRNDVVFHGQRPSLARALSCCREDALLWRGRLRDNYQSHVDTWPDALLA
ncbi:hypothetical protein ZWY2020_056491 [Hordeum vulgare]|nr:hypothetical protein ZWY2020_056491 [Hordeum vulgare]